MNLDRCGLLELMRDDLECATCGKRVFYPVDKRVIDPKNKVHHQSCVEHSPEYGAMLEHTRKLSGQFREMKQERAAQNVGVPSPKKTAGRPAARA
jgi:hypothetical protein